jgi:hypothetical protein
LFEFGGCVRIEVDGEPVGWPRYSVTGGEESRGSKGQGAHET